MARIWIQRIGRGVLLGRGLAKALGVKPGDKVRFLVNIPGGGINAVEAHLRGTFATEVKAYDDSAIRMPIALARDLLRVKGAHTVLGLPVPNEPMRRSPICAHDFPADRFEDKSWFELSDFYRKSVTLLRARSMWSRC